MTPHKKIFRNIVLFLVTIIFCTSCKKYLDVNINPNGPLTTGEKDLLAGIEAETGYNISGGMPARISAMWTQQIAYNSEPPEWDAYKWQPSDANNTWSFSMYTSILHNLKIVRETAVSRGNNHYLAIAEILTAYNLGVATDLWGDIPYDEAFKGTEGLQPKYQKQEDIYKIIFALLDSAISHGAKPAGHTAPAGGAGGDLIYGGNMNRWVKFAYFLKARHAFRLAYAPGHDKVAQSNIALQALTKAFTASGDNASFPFYDTPGTENPWNQAETKWGTFVLSDHFVKTLESKNDPRLTVYADPAEANGQYEGLENGTDPVSPTSVSHIGSFYLAADAPIYLGTQTEALFIKAEATFYTSGAAAALPIFNQAVKESMTSNGLSATDANTYLAANYPSFTDANALQAILYEKYVANYLSLEAFNDWRRTNIPTLSIVQNAVTNAIPQRWPYPSSERTNNPQPQHAILVTENVWWDTK